MTGLNIAESSSSIGALLVWCHVLQQQQQRCTYTDGRKYAVSRYALGEGEKQARQQNAPAPAS